MDEGLLEDQPDPVLGHPLEVEPALLEVGVVERHPVDELFAEDLARGELLVDGRHVNVGVAYEVRREAAHVIGLDLEVDLLGERLLELVDQADGVVAAQLRDPLLGLVGEPAQDREVGLDHLVEVGALDLEHHLAPVLEGRAVDLRDRGRGQGLVVELAEHLVHGAAELVLDELADPLAAEGLDLVLQLAQLGHELERDQVGAGRHDLAQLHEGRAEVLQREPDPLLGLELDHGRVGVRDHARLDPLQDRVEPDPRHGVAEAVLQQHLEDLRQPLQAADPLRNRNDAHRAPIKGRMIRAEATKRALSGGEGS